MSDYFSYSELVFIETALAYYANNESTNMKGIYTDNEIKKFRLSVLDLINKIVKLEKEV